MFSVWQRPQIVWGGGDEAGGGGSDKTYNSLSDAAKDGQHGKAVNIKGKGRQKVEFADKSYNKRMATVSANAGGGGGGTVAKAVSEFGGRGPDGRYEPIPGPGTIAQRISGSFAGTDSFHRPASNFKTINGSQRRALEAAGYSVTKQGTVKSRDGSATVAGSRWSRSNIVNQIMAENAEDRASVRSGGGDRVPKKIVRPQLRPAALPAPGFVGGWRYLSGEMAPQPAPPLDYDEMGTSFGSFGNPVDMSRDVPLGRRPPLEDPYAEQQTALYPLPSRGPLPSRWTWDLADTFPPSSTLAPSPAPQAPDFSQESLGDRQLRRDLAGDPTVFTGFDYPVASLDDPPPIGDTIPDLGSDPSDNREPRGMYDSPSIVLPDELIGAPMGYVPEPMTYREILEGADAEIIPEARTAPLSDYDADRLKPRFSQPLQARIDTPEEDAIERARLQARVGAGIGNISPEVERNAASDVRLQNLRRYVNQQRDPEPPGLSYDELLAAGLAQGFGIMSRAAQDATNVIAPPDMLADGADFVGPFRPGMEPKAGVPMVVGQQSKVATEAAIAAEGASNVFNRVFRNMDEKTQDAVTRRIFPDGIGSFDSEAAKAQFVMQGASMFPIVAAMVANPKLGMTVAGGATIADVGQQIDANVDARYKAGELGRLNPSQVQAIKLLAREKAAVPSAVVGGTVARFLGTNPIAGIVADVISEVALEPTIAGTTTALASNTAIKPKEFVADRAGDVAFLSGLTSGAIAPAAVAGQAMNTASAPPVVVQTEAPTQDSLAYKAGQGIANFTPPKAFSDAARLTATTMGGTPKMPSAVAPDAAAKVISGSGVAPAAQTVAPVQTLPENLSGLGQQGGIPSLLASSGLTPGVRPTALSVGNQAQYTSPNVQGFVPDGTAKLQAATIKKTGEEKAAPDIDAPTPLTPEQIANVSTDAGAELDAAPDTDAQTSLTPVQKYLLGSDTLNGQARDPKTGKFPSLDVAPTTARDAAPKQIDKNGASRPENVSAAIEVMKTDGKNSASYLQRKLRINYSEAKAINEQLEAEGYISAPDNLGRRKILTTDPTTAGDARKTNLDALSDQQLIDTVGGTPKSAQDKLASEILQGGTIPNADVLAETLAAQAAGNAATADGLETGPVETPAQGTLPGLDIETGPAANKSGLPQQLPNGTFGDNMDMLRALGSPENKKIQSIIDKSSITTPSLTELQTLVDEGIMTQEDLITPQAAMAKLDIIRGNQKKRGYPKLVSENDGSIGAARVDDTTRLADENAQLADIFKRAETEAAALDDGLALDTLDLSGKMFTGGVPTNFETTGLSRFSPLADQIYTTSQRADMQRANQLDMALRARRLAEEAAQAPQNRAQAALDAVVDPVPAAIQSIEAQRAEMLAANKTYQDYINTRAQISALDGVTKEQAEREAFAAVEQRIEDQQQQLLNAVNAEGGTAAITNAANNEIAKLQAQLNAVKEVIVNERTPLPVNFPPAPYKTTGETLMEKAAITTPVETPAMAPLVRAASPEPGGGADIDIAGSEFEQAGPDTTEAPATLREFIEQQSMSPGSDTVAPIENVAEAAPAATNTQASSAVEINPAQNPELAGGVASLDTPSLEQQYIKSIIDPSLQAEFDPTVDVGRQLIQEDLIDALAEAQQAPVDPPPVADPSTEAIMEGVMSLVKQTDARSKVPDQQPLVLTDPVEAQAITDVGGGITTALPGRIPKDKLTTRFDSNLPVDSPFSRENQLARYAERRARFAAQENELAAAQGLTPASIAQASKEQDAAAENRIKKERQAANAAALKGLATLRSPLRVTGIPDDDTVYEDVEDFTSTDETPYFPELPTDDVLPPQDSDGTGTGTGTAVDGRPYVVPPMLTVDGEDGGCPSGYQRTLNPSTGRYLCIRLEPGTVGAPSAPVEEAGEDEDGVVIDIPITERPTISPYYVPEMVESNYTPYVPGRR